MDSPFCSYCGGVFNRDVCTHCNRKRRNEFENTLHRIADDLASEITYHLRNEDDFHTREEHIGLFMDYLHEALSRRDNYTPDPEENTLT